MNIKQVSLLAIITLTGITSLAGCANSDAKVKSIKQEAKIMEQADISSLDSVKISDVGALETVNNSQEGLYRLQSGTEVKPGLAKKIVTPTNNGTVYTFKLRSNLKWSNGDKLTAKDFESTWKRAVTPATKSTNAYQFLPLKNAAAIEKGKMSSSKLGVKAINATTLRVTLERPTAYFKYLCASTPFLPQDANLVKKYGKAYGTDSTKTVYSGPFTVKNWSTSKNTWELVKNPNYWDKDNVKLDKVVFETTKDPQTALSLYQSGKLDNIILAGQQAAQLKAKAGFQSYSNGETDYIAYNFKTKALRNANIRKAISLTVDRQSLVRNVLKNGSKAPYGMAPEDVAKNPSTGADFAKDGSTSQSVQFNPTLAKKYWAKGLAQLKTKNLTLNMVCYDVDSFKNSAEFVQSSAEKYLPGLKININVEPKLQAITKMQQKSGYDLGFSNWIASYPELSEYYQLLDSGNANNAGNYSNKTFDKYYDKAMTNDSMNANQRYQDFKRAEKVAADDQAVLVVNQGQVARLNNPNLKGVSYAAASGISLKNAYMTDK
ncbi:peptide ABC transporter substrate-binding protein [Lentilactobacillus sp. Marseille-Q4993]|uniref:peptide ABC transporter substrate-binding protein n=1 Tax=Lentilactobacillus sp. Marseille-Q4993 TaxID=3039492 RepID=UPI0024BC3ED3|nr:peptide ABC transporter substrate-binding protein [Lentilactobacillus sp. Marseille-Q4993]